MEKENEYVYVVMEDWRINSGESGIYNTVFSTFKRALNYYNHIRKNYEVDYEVKDRLENNEDISITDELDEEVEYAELEMVFSSNADYYRLWIDKKMVDEEMWYDEE